MSFLRVLFSLQLILYIYFGFVVGYLTYDRVQKYNLYGLDNFLSRAN